MGQNWGAKKTDRIKSALKQVMGMEIVWGLFTCAIVYAFGGVLVRLTTGTTDAGIVDNAVMSLRWHFAFFPVLDCLLALRTAMQAMGKKKAPVIYYGACYMGVYAYFPGGGFYAAKERNVCM